MTALTSLASKEVIKGIHVKNMKFSVVLSTDIVVRLLKVQCFILVVEHDCYLFDIISTIDAQGMKKIMHFDKGIHTKSKKFTPLLSTDVVVCL